MEAFCCAAEGFAPGHRHEADERTVAASATVARVRPWLARMGITRLADLTGLDRIGLPVFAAIRPNSRSVATSQGKGLTPDAARAGALMEAVESWHAETIEAPLRLAGAAELRDRRLIAVDRLAVRAGGRFDPHRPILWMEGCDLRSPEPVWLPYELVHTDYRLPQAPSAGCFPVGTSGLAAGNTQAEAVRHALCELIERDAVSLWHQSTSGARASTAIDPRSVEDDRCRHVLRCLETAGFAVGLFDVTSDIQVRTCLAVLADRMDPAGHPGMGAACHPDATTALLKALLEAVQVRTGYIAGARDDMAPEEFAGSGPVEKLRWLEPLLALPGRRPFDHRPSGCGDAARDVEMLRQRLAAVGLDEVILVDLSRAGIDLPVVRLVVPGLEACSDEPDYAPGPRARAQSRP